MCVSIIQYSISYFDVPYRPILVYENWSQEPVIIIYFCASQCMSNVHLP